MNKFDGLRTKPLQNVSKFEGLRIKPISSPIEQKDDPWLYGKAILKGASSILDIPNLMGQGAEGVKNAFTGVSIDPVDNRPTRDLGAAFAPNWAIDREARDAKRTNYSDNIPTTDDVRGKIKNLTGVDLEPHPTTSTQRIFTHAAELAGAIPTLGLGTTSKGANYLNKGIKSLKTAIPAAGVGAVSGALQEGGVNPLVADIGTAFVAPSVSSLKPHNLLNTFKKTGELTAKIPLKIMGLSPKKLNIEAAKSAKDLGIDLPASALTNSKLTALIDQYAGKTPVFGDMISKKYANTEKQTLEALENIYNEIGPVKSPAIEKQINKLYNKHIKLLPENAIIKPVNTIKALDDIKINSASLSPDEKSLLERIKEIKNEVNPAINSQFGNVKIPPQDFDVARLIGTKRSLNSIIKWDTDEGVKKLLKKVQQGISKDIAAYGEINPEWYKSFKGADELYSKVAKRQKIEKLLSGTGVNKATDNLSYNALSKTINTPDKNAIIKKNVDPETFAKIEKLGVIAKTMALKSKNIPNPSGTAPTAATLSALIGAIYNPTAILPAATAGYGITKLLTDKKFIDLALKFAEPKSSNNALILMALNDRVKKITGYSAIALNNALSKQADKEE